MTKPLNFRPMTKGQQLLAKLSLAALVLSSAACSTPMSTVDPRATTVYYPDIAIPAETILEPDDSVIIGEGVNWTGKLLASTKTSEAEAANYILKQMQSKGWELLSSVHADKSTYFFSNQRKVMLIEVASKGALSMGGSNLTYLSSFKTGYGNTPASRTR